MRRWSVRLGSFIAVSSVTRALPYPSSISVSSLRTAACSPMMMSTSPPMSKRILSTDEPCIVQMQKMMAGKEGVLSLAQGIVHWKPPKSAAEAARNALEEDDTNSYCGDDGLASLRAALTEKIKKENCLTSSAVMVTSGSNQGYMNVVLSLLSEGDTAMVFRPYYFNHMMALQMVGASVEVAAVDEQLMPDLPQLKKRLLDAAAPHVKMITVSNPGNPNGVMLPAETLRELADACAQAGTWLIVDNAYEYFSYEAQGYPAHSCVEGPHIINTFSFSKSYGMMGWRIGYLAFPEVLGAQLLKAQDTIPICPPVMSQKAALGALQAGGAWVKEKVASLDANKHHLCTTICECLGETAVLGGSGAIYLMVRLPVKTDGSLAADVRVVEWLAAEHKVAVIPGSACGFPGHIRVCYSNLTEERCKEAATRLRAGLLAIAAGQGP